MDSSDYIIVRDNLVRAGLMMAARQLVLGLSAYLFGKSYLDGGTTEAVAAAIVFALTFAYGQVRGWIDKRKAVRLAERAPRAAVVK